jgi:hypothetical protein
VVTEVIVDHLEPIKIKEQHRYRARLAQCKPFVQMGDQCPAVEQTGQVVVLGQIEHPILGDDARLQLSE